MPLSKTKTTWTKNKEVMISKSPEVYFSKPSKSTFMPSSMTRLRHSAAKSVQDHLKGGKKRNTLKGCVRSTQQTALIWGTYRMRGKGSWTKISSRFPQLTQVRFLTHQQFLRFGQKSTHQPFLRFGQHKSTLELYTIHVSVPTIMTSWNLNRWKSCRHWMLWKDDLTQESSEGQTWEIAGKQLVNSKSEVHD